MAKITFIHYPLVCGKDGRECTICEEAEEKAEGVMECGAAGGFAKTPKALVKESNKIEFTGFDGNGYWKLRVGRRVFSGATSAIKLLKIDDVLIYSEENPEDCKA